jgi:hypothetical protein
VIQGCAYRRMYAPLRSPGTITERETDAPPSDSRSPTRSGRQFDLEAPLIAYRSSGSVRVCSEACTAPEPCRPGLARPQPGRALNRSGPDLRGVSVAAHGPPCLVEQMVPLAGPVCVVLDGLHEMCVDRCGWVLLAVGRVSWRRSRRPLGYGWRGIAGGAVGGERVVVSGAVFMYRARSSRTGCACWSGRPIPTRRRTAVRRPGRRWRRPTSPPGRGRPRIRVG